MQHEEGHLEQIQHDLQQGFNFKRSEILYNLGLHYQAIMEIMDKKEELASHSPPTGRWNAVEKIKAERGELLYKARQRAARELLVVINKYRQQLLDFGLPEKDLSNLFFRVEEMLFDQKDFSKGKPDKATLNKQAQLKREWQVLEQEYEEKFKNWSPKK